jgi:galactokinase
VTRNALGQLSPAARELAEDAARRADVAFRRMFGGEPVHRLFVPGRIEIIGKHTDYAGGHSLTGAVERGFAVSFTSREDARVRIVDAQDGRHAEFDVSPELKPPAGHWSNYPMTVARRLARNFPTVRRGADIAFFSNLPRAAGMSTSSALITAAFYVLAESNALVDDPTYATEIGSTQRLAGYLGCVENGRPYFGLAGDLGVGTFGGSQDHTAIVLSEAGRLGCYQYHPVARTHQVIVPPHLAFVVGASGIAAAKTGSARERYNRAATLVATLVARWHEATGRQDVTLGDSLASGPGAANKLRELASDAEPPDERGALRDRLEQFIIENQELVPSAVRALHDGAMGQFGALVDRSQELAERLLGNQVPETTALARLAREAGALAASSFGAGFGGSVWALIEASNADGFLRGWQSAYGSRHPDAAALSTFFVTRPGPGAGTLE